MKAATGSSLLPPRAISDKLYSTTVLLQEFSFYTCSFALLFHIFSRVVVIDSLLQIKKLEQHRLPHSQEHSEQTFAHSFQIQPKQQPCSYNKIKLFMIAHCVSY